MLSYVEKLKEGVDKYVEWFYENYDNKLNRVDGVQIVSKKRTDLDKN